MAEDDPEISGPQGPFRDREVPFSQAEELRPHQPGHPHPSGHPDDDHDVPDARLQKGDDRQNQEKGRKTEHDVHKTHDQIIHPPAVVARQRAQENSDQGGDSHGHKPHQEGDPGAVDHPAENIPPQGVGAEGMSGGGLFQHSLDLNPAGVVGRNPGGQDRNQEKKKDDGGPRRASLFFRNLFQKRRLRVSWGAWVLEVRGSFIILFSEFFSQVWRILGSTKA